MFFYKKLINLGLMTIITSVAITSISCTKKNTSVENNTVLNVLLGSVNGKDVNVANLSETQKNSLYKAQKQYYDATQNLLSEYYFAEYLENYRQQKNLPTTEEAQKSFFAENAKVQKADIDKFLKDNAESPQLKQIPEEKRSEIVGNYLNQMAQSKATQTVIQNGFRDGKIFVAMEKPVTPKFTFTAKGYEKFENVQAPITIVEFADYQCPYCVMAHNEIQKTLEHYNKNNQAKVQFVYYDFPLSFHEQAVPAAVAAYCASQQGQFWSMHDKIFTRDARDPITAENFTTYAQSLKLDMDAFKKCQMDKKSVEVVNAQMAEGMRVGVQGTPSIFINGVRYEKQTSFDGLKAEIDALM